MTLTMETAPHPSLAAPAPHPLLVNPGGSADLGKETAPEAVREVVRGPGQPLDAPTRGFMEAQIGHDFSRVRIHAGEQASDSARSMGAAAYTLGQHIVIGARQFAPSSTPGRELLAHELAHTIQSEPAALPEAGAYHISRSSRQESEAETAAQSVRSGAHVKPALGVPIPGGVGGAVHLRPEPDTAVGVNLTIDENGRVTLTASGPKLPVVGNPAIGIRRNPDGNYQIVAGGKGKVVAPADIPAMLQKALNQAAKSGQQPTVAGFRVPTCEMLTAPDGTRLMTFDEYRISQLIAPDLLPMTPALYEAVAGICQPKPIRIELPQSTPSDLGDFPASTLPEGMGMA